MDRSRFCTATFSQGPILTAAKAGTGGGTVSAVGIDCGTDCDEAYLTGTQVFLTATPDYGSTLAGWNGDCSGTGAITDVFVDAAKTCTATFDIQTVTLSVGILANMFTAVFVSRILFDLYLGSRARVEHLSI